MSYSINERCNGCAACTKLCPVAAISGEKKSLHKIDPELCIECGTCGRVCPEAAVLDERGRVCEKLKRSQWPKPIFLKGCVACTVCVETCPFACIDIQDPGPGGDKHSHSYLKDEKACVGCGMCESACPMGVIVMKTP